MRTVLLFPAFVLAVSAAVVWGHLSVRAQEPIKAETLAGASDSGRPRWLIDPAESVSRHDVLYTAPSPEPWEAMPTGGGDLSAFFRGRLICLILAAPSVFA